jgi:RHS repeat-associated protein
MGNAKPSGNIIETYDLDEFGSQIFNQGTTQNVYRYTGQQSDADSGLLYLRARYYEPTTGRFISQDTKMPDKKEPITFNLYVYCRNNPIRYTDPSGLDVYIQYPKELDESNTYLINWQQVRKAIHDATDQAVWTVPYSKDDATTGYRNDKGELLYGQRGADVFVTVMFVSSNYSMFGSAAGDDCRINILQNWEQDFYTMSGMPDYQQYANFQGFSTLATNKINHEFWHAIMGNGGHVNKNWNVMQNPANIQFMQRILYFNEAQRNALKNNCPRRINMYRNLHFSD